MKQRKSVKVRDGLAVGMTALSLVFSLACVTEDDNSSNNDDNNGSNNGSGNITVSGGVTGETTWRGIVNVTGSVDVTGGTLTIEPGTTIIMCADCSLEVGWNSSAATIVANGTADKPITFRGASPGKGFWGQVLVSGNVTSNSSMSNVIIDGGGSVGSSVESSFEVRAPIGVSGVKIRNAATAGAELYEIKPGSSLEVESADGYGVIFADAKALTGPPTLTFGTLGKNMLPITDKDWSETGEVQLKDYGVPYYVPKSVENSDGTFIIDAGARFIMGPDVELEFGWNSSVATVQMNGTAEKPITFEGEVAEKGSWYGLIIGNNVATTSKLEHVVVRRGGGEDRYGALRVDAALTLKDVKIEDSKGYGLDVDEAGVKSGSANVSVSGTEGHPMRINSRALLTTPVGGMFEGNSKNSILVDGNSAATKGTLPVPGIPYFFDSNMDLTDGADWTIPGGVTLQFGGGRTFEAGWNSGDVRFKVEGTAAAPVVFEAANAASPWGGLIISRDVSSDSIISGATVRGGGEAGAPLLDLYTKITVEGSTFSGTPGNAIVLDSAKAEDEAYLNELVSKNTFEGVGGKNVCGESFPGDMLLACE
jgi:hypothetical protein